MSARLYGKRNRCFGRDPLRSEKNLTRSASARKRATGGSAKNKRPSVFGAGPFAPVDYGVLLNLPLPPGLNLSTSLFFEAAIALAVMGAATMMIDNLGHPREEDPEAEAELAEIDSIPSPRRGEG